MVKAGKFMLSTALKNLKYVGAVIVTVMMATIMLRTIRTTHWKSNIRRIVKVYTTIDWMQGISWVMYEV